MKRFSAFIVFTILFLLFGCSTPMITEDGQKIILHSQMSTAINGCKKLGNIVAEAPIIPLIGDDDKTRQQSINNLRDVAYKKYQADTVVLINVDHIGNTFSPQKYVAQGIAYNCD